MIGKLDNNPLKFSATPEEAMRVLLLQNIPGFLSAEQAVGQALQDIKSHQLAVMAGMQTALTTVIARFDPAQLEKRIEKSSLIEGVLPGARKARYWDLFRKLYGDIARELEDDLQSLFGAEFAAAYRAQIEKLQEGGETE
jgi:type VI secretion system FHA domain protein